MAPRSNREPNRLNQPQMVGSNSHFALSRDSNMVATTCFILGNVRTCEQHGKAPPVDKTEKAAESTKPGQIGSSEQQTLTLQRALDLALQHHSAGDLHEAEGIYQQILQTDTKNPSALHLLGVIAHQEGENEGAVGLISKALAIKPDYAEAHNNLGLALQELGRLEEAVASYHKALAIQPNDAAVHSNLGKVLWEMGQLEEAIASCQKALAIKPKFAKAHCNLGTALQEVGSIDEALIHYHKAIDINPHYAEAYNNIGVAVQELGQLDEAVTYYRKALAIKPNFAEAFNNLGNAFKPLRQLDDAVSTYRKALAIKPDYTKAGRNLLFAMQNLPGLSPEELFTECLRFSETHTRDIPRPTKLTNNRSPDRRLRVGYMSSDFRDHPVGRHILPLLSSHDRAKFEVHCYAEVLRPDAITERFRSCIDHWHTTVGKSDAEVAKMVRADGIDVLVCLAGHYDNNRPLVCAHRAAPVQVSYHDVPTSGLEEMDYLLTDDFLNPPDTKEMFTEELYRLPVFFHSPPIENAPPVAAVPAEQTGMITFGSFNNPAKMNDEVIRLWSEVLGSVSGSRLLLKNKNLYHQTSLRGGVLERFQAYGIGQDRIVFAVTLDRMREHLERYREVDIALDPFPFNGATTTFQALWMGVPVVSLAGNTFISRTAGSILHHLGLGELLVDTPEAYVACARDLAGDIARLKTFRTTLRDRITASPLCDATTCARNVEAAYRDMWRTWCAQPHNTP